MGGGGGGVKYYSDRDWWSGVVSLSSLPDNNAKYDERDGTNHSEDAHFLPGLLL